MKIPFLFIFFLSVFCSFLPVHAYTYDSAKQYVFIEGRVITEDSKTAISKAKINFTTPRTEVETANDGSFIVAFEIPQTSLTTSFTVNAPGYGQLSYENFLVAKNITRKLTLALKVEPYTITERTEIQSKYPTANSIPKYPSLGLFLNHKMSESSVPTQHFSSDKKTLFIGWMFEQVVGWEENGYGVGEGDHKGDDYYAKDFNYYEPGDESRSPYGDLGKLALAGITGEVIFADQNFPACPVPICWYGNQVVIYDSEHEVALRYTHLKDVYVSQGQQVSMFDPIGTIGDSGLSGNAPYSAHLHEASYGNLEQLSARKDQAGKTFPARYWLQFGAVPECILVCNSPTNFALTFTPELDKTSAKFSITPTSLLETKNSRQALELTTQLSKQSSGIVIEPIFPTLSDKERLTVTLNAMYGKIRKYLP